MEEELVGLSIEDDEDEAWEIQAPDLGMSQAMNVDDLLHSLFLEAMAQQFCNFIGLFIDYDANTITRGFRNYMRIRVMVEVRVPLRQKELALAHTNQIYARLQSERLSLFCFLCGRFVFLFYLGFEEVSERNICKSHVLY
ncbi:hypothetical protein J1N35_020471 [Gossypium stocksii]|uniref:Uncharacterized protein n=1 Tax=Gossypium stocksii TaxID=47602 RepID=A0A9D4A117_9ROSI|nr:hypothetical protein J1N35_020471 [Gossypium stocksii]